MSGGAFDYNQYRIRDIYQEIETRIRNQGNADRWGDKDPIYPKPILAKFKKAIKVLKIAEVYAQRVDWLISGDDGEESFLERLKEELEVLK
jgi:hypothetical protein